MANTGSEVKRDLFPSVRQLRDRFEVQTMVSKDPDKQMEACADSVSEGDLPVEKNLRDEILAFHKKTSEQKLALQGEMQQLKTQLDTQLRLNSELSTELGDEKERNKALQDASYQDTKMYEAELLRAKQQAESLQHELEEEMKAHAARMTEHLVLEENLRTENDTLSLAKQKASDENLVLKKESEELKSQLNTQVTLNSELTTEFEAKTQKITTLQEELEKLQASYKDLQKDTAKAKDEINAIKKQTTPGLDKSSDENLPLKNTGSEVKRDLFPSVRQLRDRFEVLTMVSKDPDKQMEACADRVSEGDLPVEKNLRDEILAFHKKTSEQKLALQGEMQQLKSQLDTQLRLNSELSTELGDEKERNKALQEASYQDTQMYEAELLRAKQQALGFSLAKQKASDKNLVLKKESEELKSQLNTQLTLNSELTTEFEAKTQKITTLQEELEKLQASYQDLQKDTAKAKDEIDAIKKQTTPGLDKSSDENLALKKELEELRAQFNCQLSLNHELTAELQVERRNNQPPQEDMAPTPERRNNQPPQEDMAPTPERSNNQPPQEDMAPTPERSNNQPPQEDMAPTPDRRSTWTSIRHSLGLRKPQRWKRSRVASPSVI